MRRSPQVAALLLLCSLALSLSASVASLDRLVIGVVYNIFHEEYADDAEFFAQVDHDIPAIKAAGFNHVLLFPMNEWDPATRQRLWKRTDYVVKRIEEAGLKFVPLMLKEEQCAHYFPIWKFRELPERWDLHHRRDGGRNNRENVDFADPRVFPLLEDSFRAVAERYGKSPALSFYNIWNEPHYNSDADHVVVRFRAWLQRKYGTLDALRRSWAEDYTSWEEVTPFLNDDWNSSMPAIDWRLFRNELNGVLLGELATALRRYDPTHPVNANPVGAPLAGMGEFGGYNTDNWQFTRYNDFNGLSYYPDAWERDHKGQPHPLWLHNMNFNVVRCASGDRGYLLTELYTNTKNGLSLDGYLDPATLKRLCWTALANDCKGIIFWKWEPFRRGRQALGRGLSRLDGSLAPRGEAVAEFARQVQVNDALLREAHPVPAQAAMIIDQVGLLKTLDQPNDPRTRTFMHESHAGLFKALNEANIPIDVLRADLGLEAAQLRRYRILFLPFQIVMRSELAALLEAYVREGGCLVADARTATLDELDLAYRRSPGAGLDQVFAAERIDWLAAPKNHAVVPAPAQSLPAFSGRYFREQLRLHPKAQVLSVFPDTGEPALICHSYGQGLAFLSAVPLGASYHESADKGVATLLVELCARAGVKAPARFVPSAEGGAFSLQLHRSTAARLLYILNPSDTPASGLICLPATQTPVTEAQNLLTGESSAIEVMGVESQFRIALPGKGVGVFLLKP